MINFSCLADLCETSECPAKSTEGPWGRAYGRTDETLRVRRHLRVFSGSLPPGVLGAVRSSFPLCVP